MFAFFVLRAIAMLYHDRRQYEKRRIGKAFAKFYLLFIKALIVLFLCVTQRVMFRIVRLYQYFSGTFSST